MALYISIDTWTVLNGSKFGYSHKVMYGGLEVP